MGPLAIAGIMAAAGLLKSKFIDDPKAKKQHKLRAMEIAMNPWSKGEVDGPVKDPDSLGTAMNFGLTGAALGQNMENNEAYNNYLNRGAPVTEMQGGFNRGAAQGEASMPSGWTSTYGTGRYDPNNDPINPNQVPMRGR